jgi:hypothetical protein
MITVSHLSKHFCVAQPGRGLGGKVKRLFAPQYKTIRAVDDVSFQIGEGEIVGYLGPNGAGKVLVRDGKVLIADEAAVRAEAQVQRRRLRGAWPQIRCTREWRCWRRWRRAGCRPCIPVSARATAYECAEMVC